MEPVGSLSANTVCVETLDLEQRWLGRGPEEEKMLGTGGLQEKLLVVKQTPKGWGGVRAPGSVGASPTAPRVQFWIMSSAQKAKSPKLRYCSFFFPVSKRLLAKKTMAA